MLGGAGSALINCPCPPMGHRNVLCDQEAPGSIALLHACAARDDTSVPTVSARASTAGRVVIHPTPGAIRHVQPLHRTCQGADPANVSSSVRRTLTGRATSANCVWLELPSGQRRPEPSAQASVAGLATSIDPDRRVPDGSRVDRSPNPALYRPRGPDVLSERLTPLRALMVRLAEFAGVR